MSSSRYDLKMLFGDYNNLEEIKVEGIAFSNVSIWLFARKRAYAKYREKFTPDRLREGDQWKRDYSDFPHFRHNQSWSTLYRSGLEALSDPERLKDLLIYIQDESISIEKRVEEGLQGKYHCQGVRKNILTGLLHTFKPDSYGVWNNRTEDTLKKTGQMPTITGLCIEKKTPINKIETAKELLRALGLNPEQILTKDALSQGAVTTKNADELQNYQFQLLSQTLRQLLHQEATVQNV